MKLLAPCYEAAKTANPKVLILANGGTFRSVDGAIVYGALADNDKCTPLAYTAEAAAGSGWRKVDEVRVSPLPARVHLREIQVFGTD